MTLRVLAGGSPEAVDSYRAATFDLAVHPMRPGLAHEAVTLTLDARLAAAVERGAAVEGLPTPLWAGLAIESERALRARAHDTGLAATALERALDAAADATGCLAAGRGRRLVRYGLALRGRGPREMGPPCRRLTIAVPQHTLTAWELAATLEGQAVDGWAAASLEALPAGRPRWEYAAALAGQTLAEWVAVQAARRSSS